MILKLTGELDKIDEPLELDELLELLLDELLDELELLTLDKLEEIELLEPSGNVDGSMGSTHPIANIIITINPIINSIVKVKFFFI